MKMNTPSNIKAFELAIRIYYEDTDAAGVVYYANYLKFFERCRTEWLRSIGYDQVTLAQEHKLVFVVRAVNIEYLKPGSLDDNLVCSLEIEKVGGAQIIFRQRIRRNETTLVTGTVQIVCVDLDAMKSTPIPVWLRKDLENLENRA